MGWRSESKRKRIRSMKKASSPSCSWRWKLVLLILTSCPQLDDASWANSHNILLAASSQKCHCHEGHAVVSAGCYLHRRAPSLKEAEDQSKRLSERSHRHHTLHQSFDQRVQISHEFHRHLNSFLLFCHRDV
jgi:hypothetical protein